MTNDNGLKLFCMGLGLGVAGAILFAPKSGSDSRQFLKDKADRGRELLSQQAQNLADSAADVVNRGAKAVRYQKENLTAAAEAYRDAAAATPPV